MKRPDMSWMTYARLGTGRRLSMLGEKLGIHWLIYNPLHFRHFHGNAVANANGVIGTMRQVFPECRRWLDVGAGSGAFADEAQRQGVTVIACEHSPSGRKMGRKLGVDIRPFDLADEPPVVLEGEFDLAYCFEVAEHLPEAMGRTLVRFLAEVAPVVVFTAAYPGQGGTGHINEQPKEYWIKAFAEAGMAVDESRTQQLLEGFRAAAVPAAWFHDNAIVFRR